MPYMRRLLRYDGRHEQKWAVCSHYLVLLLSPFDEFSEDPWSWAWALGELAAFVYLETCNYRENDTRAKIRAW